MVKQQSDLIGFTRQSALMKLAIACRDTQGKSYILFYEVCMMILAHTGVEPLQKKWGEQYESKMARFKAIGLDSGELNYYLIGLEDTKLNKDEYVIHPNFLKSKKIYVNIISELELFFETFVILLEATPKFKFQDMPHTYIFGESKGRKF